MQISNGLVVVIHKVGMIFVSVEKWNRNAQTQVVVVAADIYRGTEEQDAKRINVLTPTKV